MNGKHFTVKDLKREFEAGKKQGAVEREIEVLLWFQEKLNCVSVRWLKEDIKERLLVLKKGE